MLKSVDLHCVKMCTYAYRYIILVIGWGKTNENIHYFKF